MMIAYRSCDPGALYDAVGADRAGFDQLLGMFVVSAPRMLAGLHQSQRDGADPTHQLHELRSSALLVGAGPLSLLLAGAETRARASGAPLDDAALHAIGAELDAVLHELQRALACPGHP